LSSTLVEAVSPSLLVAPQENQDLENSVEIISVEESMYNDAAQDDIHQRRRRESSPDIVQQVNGNVNGNRKRKYEKGALSREAVSPPLFSVVEKKQDSPNSVEILHVVEEHMDIEITEHDEGVSEPPKTPANDDQGQEANEAEEPVSDILSLGGFGR
jgi:hypothetical protein